MGTQVRWFGEDSILSERKPGLLFPQQKIYSIIYLYYIILRIIQQINHHTPSVICECKKKILILSWLIEKSLVTLNFESEIFALAWLNQSHRLINWNWKLSVLFVYDGLWHSSCVCRALSQDQDVTVLSTLCQMPPWTSGGSWWLSGWCGGYSWLCMLHIGCKNAICLHFLSNEACVAPTPALLLSKLLLCRETANTWWDLGFRFVRCLLHIASFFIVVQCFPLKLNVVKVFQLWLWRSQCCYFG